ncbi:Ribosomal large subunit pseudouridine synthase D [uncultured Eubacterium sp.]|uniref:RluA family pseudouridine synthase n=1 Tax=Brotomerdimonas butyrica TaxID=2981721 RepID=UPI0008220D04|nr:RluA family pseudouridine synthase [Brotomerdimonas butyrica]MCU6756472.1 RluA family pseudouridine synthase [Brotomerdimonas butyrica]SCH86656.1 Ribosomal large subunit pseudouridine synthase D [uncultured Eubacterium sp.]
MSIIENENLKGEQKVELTVAEEMSGKRLDSVLAGMMPEYSRSFIQKLFENGSITVGGDPCSEKKRKAVAGDIVEIAIPQPERLEVEAEDIPLDIVYEDDELLVVDKPAGMVVHPAPGNHSGTLVNALMYHCGDALSSINGVIRPGIVHRIDKDTSGLLMVAKTDRAHNALSAQLAEHSITRRYKAIVYSNIKEDEGTVDKPIGRDPGNRLRNAVVYTNSKNAVTHYRVLERFGGFTLVEAVLETGRTHQIRVHMAYIRHPLLGDTLYGPAKNRYGAKRQMLHAGVLGFVHPVTGEYMEFNSPLPQDFEDVLAKLRK